MMLDNFATLAKFRVYRQGWFGLTHCLTTEMCGRILEVSGLQRTKILGRGWTLFLLQQSVILDRS